ncbi:hypothetical protein [Oscillatoria salina]|uniref:hypothetical protein n=1 Tax=Oscillatoria salina TaxID=331517 RepID=UPI0013B9A16F|nr:hypothetical protein [Oscillatoria salina]MBZ8181032.1 hypothetical protein [Oscillatoria salina IIICB1]NET90799.1 hypothetical protein [Kamptonema sp. SIO1D9]
MNSLHLQKQATIFSETVEGTIASVNPLRVKAFASYYPARWHEQPNRTVCIGNTVLIKGRQGITLLIVPI